MSVSIRTPDDACASPRALRTISGDLVRANPCHPRAGGSTRRITAITPARLAEPKLAVPVLAWASASDSRISSATQQPRSTSSASSVAIGSAILDGSARRAYRVSGTTPTSDDQIDGADDAKVGDWMGVAPAPRRQTIARTPPTGCVAATQQTAEQTLRGLHDVSAVPPWIGPSDGPCSLPGAGPRSRL